MSAFVDTNVLVRHFTGDPPVIAARATAYLSSERELLLTQLADALGLGRRARRQGGDAERARKAVGMRLRDTIGRIEQGLPSLGRHLRVSVQTGVYCTYAPERPMHWQCQP